MCFLTFEDRSGTVEVLIFPTLYPEARPFLESGEPFLLEGTVSLKEEETPKVLADRIVGVRELDSLPERRCLYLKFNSAEDRRIPEVLRLLKTYPGGEEVRFYFSDEGKYRYPPDRLQVDASETLIEALRELLGQGNVAIK